MSLLRTKGLQIGQDGTATNNFTLYQPGVPDGTLRIGNGNNGSVTDAITLSSNGNVGIGTSSPSVKLHLKGANFGSAIRWEETGGNNNFYAGPLDSSGNFGIDNNSASGYIRFVTNSTERMRIKSDGVVSMSNQPYFYAVRSSSLTVNPSNQTEAIVYDSVTRNIGNCYNGSTGLFTAPVNGIYAFTAGVIGFTFSQLWAIENGTRTTSFYLGSTSNNAGSFIKYLNANDTLGIHAYDGASSGTISVNQHHTYFEGGLIG